MDLKKNRLARYIFVGGLAYLIEMFAIYLLKACGLSSVQSVAVSYWVGLITAFVLQKYIAFENYEKDIKSIAKQLTYYLLLVFFNYIFSLSIVYLLDKSFDVYLLRSSVIIICTFWNYLIYKKIFNNKND